MASTTSFPAETVPQAPEDALFGLARAYKADTSPLKVDLVCRKLSVLVDVVFSLSFFLYRPLLSSLSPLPLQP